LGGRKPVQKLRIDFVGGGGQQRRADLLSNQAHGCNTEGGGKAYNCGFERPDLIIFDISQQAIPEGGIEMAENPMLKNIDEKGEKRVDGRYEGE
jgi:hypothetical protein